MMKPNIRHVADVLLPALLAIDRSTIEFDLKVDYVADEILLAGYNTKTRKSTVIGVLRRPQFDNETAKKELIDKAIEFKG
jgi:hypothetical protein